MFNTVSVVSKGYIAKGVLALICLGASVMPVQAELKELDDKKLKEQTAKAGVTIDLESQLTIGEMYLDMGNKNKKLKIRQNYVPQNTNRITYDIDHSRR